MRLSLLDGQRLWVVTLAAIVGIVVANAVIRGPGHTASPIMLRLAAAAIVTVFVVATDLIAGRRAAALTGVAGVLVAVLVLDWMY